MMQHWISSVPDTGRTAKRAPSPVGEFGQHIPPSEILRAIRTLQAFDLGAYRINDGCQTPAADCEHHAKPS